MLASFIYAVRRLSILALHSSSPGNGYWIEMSSSLSLIKLEFNMIKRIAFWAIAMLIGAASASGQTNSSLIDQIGSENSAAIDQMTTVYDNTSTVYTNGSMNGVSLTQSNGKNSSEILQINSNNNTVTTTQTNTFVGATNSNVQTIIQFGSNNAVNGSQSAFIPYANNNASAVQAGSDSRLDYYQYAFRGGMADNPGNAFLSAQIGNGNGENYGNIQQTNQNSGNRAFLFQDGGGNAATISQGTKALQNNGYPLPTVGEGGSFVAFTAQLGDGNRSTTSQTDGAGGFQTNIALTFQFGNSNVALTNQTGSNSLNVSAVFQISDDGYVSVNQDDRSAGKSNISLVGQVGGPGNEAIVSQTAVTSNNVSAVAQAGSNNFAHVTQH